MRASLLSLLAVCVPSFGFGLLVGQEDDPLIPPGWRERSAEDREALLEGLVGNWSLVSFEHATNDLSTVGLAGHMGITEDHLTFVVHTSEPDATLFREPRRFQGGVHYWRLADDLKLQTSSILSHTNFDLGRLEFEPQYTPREYEVVLDDTELSLVRSDGSVLRFLRVETIAFPEIAIQILEEARSGIDPFRDR